MADIWNDAKPFNVELWTPGESGIVRVLSQHEKVMEARAAFADAIDADPRRRLLLRHRIQVLARHAGDICGCGDSGQACEDHPDKPMGHGACTGAGMPCPRCSPAEPG